MPRCLTLACAAMVAACASTPTMPAVPCPVTHDTLQGGWVIITYPPVAYPCSR